jgi:uncharacterized membrane protein YcaP (DUF421 family)
MQRELLTEEELISQLRQLGVEDYRTVKYACLEPDGGVSVINVGTQETPNSPPPKQHGVP